MKILDIGTEPASGYDTLRRSRKRWSCHGIDLSEKMIYSAKEVAKQNAVQNISFLVMNAEDPKFPEGSFDPRSQSFWVSNFTNPKKLQQKLAKDSEREESSGS